jgi:hypothetical protein
MWRKAPNRTHIEHVTFKTAVNIFAKHSLTAGRNQTTVTVPVPFKILHFLGHEKRSVLGNLSSYRLGKIVPFFSPSVAVTCRTLSNCPLRPTHFLPPYHFSTPLKRFSHLGYGVNTFLRKVGTSWPLQGAEIQKKTIIWSTSAVET